VNPRIYFDHSATTPLDPRVVDAMAQFLGGAFGNPSSQHNEGRIARAAVEKARAEVASLIGAAPEEIIFTASGTEADNLALLGVIEAKGAAGHVVTTAIEHAAVLHTCRALEKRGTKITYLAVNGEGLVCHRDLLRALQGSVDLVSIMAANNVVGTVQPIEELAQLSRLNGALFHTDAVQAAGKIPLDVNRLRVDLLSLSAHKLHGPKGVGTLYVRKGVQLSPIIFGGGHERGLRSATENVAGIVGFGTAAVIARQELEAEKLRLSKLRVQIADRLRDLSSKCYFFGHLTERLPGHLSFGFRGHESETGALISVLDEAGVAVSAGSACNAHHSGEPSGVLLAMGYNEVRARGLIRLSLGRFSTQEEIDRFFDKLSRALVRLKWQEHVPAGTHRDGSFVQTMLS